MGDRIMEAVREAAREVMERPAVAQVTVDGVGVRIEEARGVIHVKGYCPGNGTRYDLEIVPRIGGLYLLLWDAAACYGRLSPGDTWHGGRALWELRAGRCPKVDRLAIETLCGELFRRGVLC